jgi:hypothetical protein
MGYMLDFEWLYLGAASALHRLYTGLAFSWLRTGFRLATRRRLSCSKLGLSRLVTVSAMILAWLYSCWLWL